jgi:type IV secretory pathway component VirB8
MNSEIKFYTRTITVLIAIVLIAYVSIVNILESKKFDQYIVKFLTIKIEKLANKDLTEEERQFLIKNLKKIYIKLKPILEEIK